MATEQTIEIKQIADMRTLVKLPKKKNTPTEKCCLYEILTCSLFYGIGKRSSFVKYLMYRPLWLELQSTTPGIDINTLKHKKNTFFE